MNRILVSMIVLVTLAPMSAIAAFEPPPTPVVPEHGVAIYGTEATCKCQGNGKIDECSGSSCSCSHDWAGDPECTASDSLALVKIL